MSIACGGFSRLTIFAPRRAPGDTSPFGSSIATRRMTQASPSCHFHGKPWNVQRLPVTLVKIAADILDGRDAGREQRLVRRIPFREILDRLAPGRLLVFRQQIFDLRPVAVRAERGGERMIDARGVDADQLHLLLHQPLGGALAQARRVAEIFLAVGISAMPAGVDQHDVVGLDLRLGAFQIGRLDQLPFLLRDRDARRRCRRNVRAPGRRPPPCPARDGSAR